tara:strand:- start:230 stop:646 length:417 start_codon:yes stop_codon:yes gene_type:complete
MANHKSAIKRTRSDYTKNQHNKYLHKTTRNAIKKLITGQVSANLTEISKVFSLIDKLVKSNVIHKNKAANLKSKLSKLIAGSDKEQAKNKKSKKEKVVASNNNSEVKSEVEEAPVEEAPVEEAPVEEERKSEDSLEKE